jgi:SAM-dependent methyltransferase
VQELERILTLTGPGLSNLATAHVPFATGVMVNQKKWRAISLTGKKTGGESGMKKIREHRLENEITHGKYLLEHGAGEVWNWETPAGKVRWARRVSMLTSSVRHGMNILELGCGTGYFTKEIVKTNANVTAVDISPDLLNDAIKSTDHPNVTFKTEDACHMSFPGNTFDKVIGSSVLHHLDIDKATGEIYRVLKPGGEICFTEPNMLNPQIAAQKNIPWLKRKLGDSPDETAFFRFILKRKLVKAGFRNVKIVPFDFLHPAIPEKLIHTVSRAGLFFEKIPLIREIAGSLYITANK